MPGKKFIIIKNCPLWIWVTAMVAIVFGLVTIKAGGSVLFFDGEARQAAGNYVGMVLWFNFIAGFFYVVTGIALFLEKAWASTAAISIAILTILIFCIFGFYIFNDGVYEQRTVYAMS
ncbi:MAG: hypothetical protein GY808_13020 [Gammaproteobacteria bacterium]|nr:hypothetical protein [Gammaproteobacteria bacterium]